jgi:hypothetical protein
MAKSQSLLSKAVMVEKEVTTGTATGTLTGPAVGAGTLVLAAGVELVGTVGTASTSHVIKVTDGSTDFMADTDINSAAAGTFAFGTQTQAVIAANDTIDATQTIVGTGQTAATARIWAIVVDVNEATRGAAEVDRDQLA